MRKIIRKAPSLLLIAGSAILLTIMALAGKNNIYKEQQYNYLKTPALALLFQGVHEDRYPWQIFSEPDEEKEEALLASSLHIETGYNLAQPEVKITLLTEPVPDVKVDLDTNDSQSMPPGEEEPMDEIVEIQPLRSSTQEEYLNHISADIYGTAGVERAATYEFVPVNEDYFDDALFIGDSRTVGLRDYSSISEHSDFLCATALTVHKIFNGNIGDSGSVETALQSNDYRKIYLSVGINELGRGTTEDFTEAYRDVVNKLRDLEPDAVIIIQGTMKVTKEKSDADPIYNNSNIEARNRAIATLADNQHIYYIDVNEVICDEEGNLNADTTHDGIHLLGSHNENYKQFLLTHGVDTGLKA